MGEPEDAEDMDEINRFNKFVSKVINSLAKSLSEANPEEQRIHGLEVRIGKNNIPVMEGFSDQIQNLKTTNMQPNGPLVDIIDEDGFLHVVTELKGVEKESIMVSAKPEEVNISVIDNVHTYNRTINMPCLIDPEFAEGRYNNGILELFLKKMHSSVSKTIKIK